MRVFYDTKELFSKALKIYSSAKCFVDFIENGSLFPLTIKLKSLKQSEVQQNYAAVLKELKILKNENLELVYKKFDFKSIGVQHLPIAVNFQTRENFLNYISKSKEFEEFQKEFKHVVAKYPLLHEFILKKPFEIVKYSGLWEQLLLVCNFFINNSKPNIYIRELSIEGIDTKFIESYKKILDSLLVVLLKEGEFNVEISSFSNYGFEKKYYLKYPLPTVRFRILDNKQTVCGLSDISLTIEEFKNLDISCKNVFIVENKITTLSFPLMKDSMVIFGSGYGVEVLKDVLWLRKKELFYWGDIDLDGFEILSQTRGYFSNVKSIFMDKETIKKFKNYAIKIKRIVNKKSLQNLTITEKILYENLEPCFRLEQERIPLTCIKDKLYDNTF